MGRLVGGLYRDRSLTVAGATATPYPAEVRADCIAGALRVRAAVSTAGSTSVAWRRYTSTAEREREVSRRRWLTMLVWLNAQVKAGRRGVPTSAGRKPALVRVSAHMRRSRGEPGARDWPTSAVMVCLPRTTARLTVVVVVVVVEVFVRTGRKDTGAMGLREGVAEGVRDGWGVLIRPMQAVRREPSLRAKVGGGRHASHRWRAVVLHP